tara:strand:- start:7504 stop:8196 length:693 start_codon:yes stop_codon:yes gene_type:complete
MAEVILSSDDLTVLGGPAIVQLDLNIGPAGNRGVFVLYGTGDPRVVGTQFTTVPQIFDLYVLTNPASADYLQIFQYTSQDGLDQWVPAIKLSQNFYATTRVLPFVAGESSITFNSFELGLFQERLSLPTLVGSAAYLNVQATPGNFDFASYLNPGLALPLQHYPTSMSVLVNDLFLDVDDELKFKIDLKAAEFDGTTWTNVNGKALVVHFYMQIVDPTFIANAIAELGGS